MKYRESGICFAIIAICLATNTAQVNKLTEKLGPKEFSSRNANYKTKIVAGVNATEDQAAWNVLVDGYFDGTIISPNYVLMTAAICSFISDLPFKIKIEYGGINRYNLSHSTTIKEMIIHPNYSGINSTYNFCITRLNDPIQISETVKIIPIATVRPSSGTKANLTAWGDIDGNWSPATLQFGEFTIISRDECLQNWKNITWKPITNDMICGDAKNTSACFFDWGGPLVVDGELVGILSLVDLNCSPIRSGVFADTVLVRDWIKSIINTEEEGDSTTSNPTTTSTFQPSTTSASPTTPGGDNEGNSTPKQIINISIKLNIKIDLSNSSNPVITSDISRV